MKRCLACEGRFESDDWTCPSCGYRPAVRNEVFQFAEDSASAQAGFKPEYFARLAAIEPGHFWFRARNALIQWALGKYFPNAESFFEIGCGTGYVLAGIRENFPRMRLVGSDIFTDGLVFAKARLPGVELYQMDARRIFFECEFDVVGAFDVLEHLVEDESCTGTNVQCGPARRWIAGDRAATALFVERERSNSRCINVATAAPNCARKVRERRLPDRANHFFQFTVISAYDLVAYATKTRSAISNPGANLKSVRRLTKLWRAF